MSDTPWLDPWCQHSIGLTCSNCAVPWVPPVEPETVFKRPGVPDRGVERFALDADVTVYWPWVRPCWDDPR